MGFVVKCPAQFSLSVFLRFVERLNTRNCLPACGGVCDVTVRMFACVRVCVM